MMLPTRMSEGVIPAADEWQMSCPAPAGPSFPAPAPQRVIAAHPLSTWQTIYRDHGPAVLRFLRSRIGPQEADDLLQETFVRAIRAEGRTAEGEVEQLRPYLLTIARNLVINRHRAARPVQSLEADEDRSAPPAAAITDANATSQLADFRNLAERTREALEKLNENQRRAFQMAVLDQVPYREVARRTGWSLSRVKVTVHRARRIVINELGDYLA